MAPAEPGKTEPREAGAAGEPKAEARAERHAPPTPEPAAEPEPTPAAAVAAAAAAAAAKGATAGAADGTDWQARAAENYDRFLRARADYENLLRRMQKDVAISLRLGKKGLLLRLLELADNLRRGIAAWQKALAVAEGLDSAGLIDGLAMIERQLQAILAQEGVKAIEAVGQPFDPAFHEAVAAWESADVARETVSDEISQGYTLDGEVLRAARVRVARPPA